MKLNLASGTDIKDPPWVNLDVVPRWPIARRGCDVVWDARHQDIPFPDGSADEVYAGYLFLHLAPRYHQPVIREIWRVLQPGGVLLVGETDMERVMPRWIESPDDRGLYESIWGEQGDYHASADGVQRVVSEFEEFDTHKHGWTEKKLRGFLDRAGFRDIERVQIHAEAVWWELTLACRRP